MQTNLQSLTSALVFLINKLLRGRKIKMVQKPYDGIFDNTQTNCREMWKKGALVSSWEKRIIGNTNSPSPIISNAWLFYPEIQDIDKYYERSDLE